MPGLLEIENLTIEFPLRDQLFRAAKDVSFSIKAGEIVGIVGESGAGKSTLGNAIIQLLPNPGRIGSGKIHFDGRDLSDLNPTQMRKMRGKDIGFIFQDPMSSLNPLFTIGTQLIETMQAHLPISDREARKQAAELLGKVGIPHPEERLDHYPHQFSGGMRQRVVIAIALCCDPKLIIADEPTTALDVSVQDQILELIKKLCKERQVGVLLVTHDMGVVANTADKIVVMYRGNVVEEGKTREVLLNPQKDYTRALISAVPPSKKKLRRFPSVDYIEKEEDILPEIDLKTHWLGSQNSEVHQETEFLLELKNVSLEFVLKDSWQKKNRKILKANDDISLKIKPGMSFGLVGESGSGKSTLARVVCGLYQPNKGSVVYRGMDLNRAGREDALKLRREIQMIFQNPFSGLNPRKSVFTTVAEPIFYHKLLPKQEVTEVVNALLDHVGLGSRAGAKYPHEFSGGQQQRISIARALACRPRFLICDEPTSALDVSVQAKILNLLKDLQDELGLTILFITHDLPVVRQMCDEIAIMQLGKILETGKTETIFSSPAHSYTKELLNLMPALDNAFGTEAVG